MRPSSFLLPIPLLLALAIGTARSQTSMTVVNQAGEQAMAEINETMASGRAHWLHPYASCVPMADCSHMVIEHPEGHTQTTPCAHPPVPLHDGHTQTTSCVSPLHSHFGTPGASHTYSIACAHLEPPHSSDTVTVPCVELVPQHSEGHPPAVAQCPHPIQPDFIEEKYNTWIYGGAAFRGEVLTLLERLKGSMGIDLNASRTLHVVNRREDGIGTETPRYPFWSHYEDERHAVVLGTDSVPDDEALAHELGHALVGSQCAIVFQFGGTHQLLSESYPGMAFSEGWAHFAGMVIRGQSSTDAGSFLSWGETFDMENGLRPSGAEVTGCNDEIEFCVAMMLWDLFDTNQDVIIEAEDTALGKAVVDGITLPFSELFRVFSPTLQTVLNSPVVGGLKDYVQRLCNNAGVAGLDLEAPGAIGRRARSCSAYELLLEKNAPSP